MKLQAYTETFQNTVPIHPQGGISRLQESLKKVDHANCSLLCVANKRFAKYIRDRSQRQHHPAKKMTGVHQDKSLEKRIAHGLGKISTVQDMICIRGSQNKNSSA